MFTRGTDSIARVFSRKSWLIVFFFVASIGIGSSAKYAFAGTESALGWLWGGAEMLDVNGGTPPNNGVIDGDENGLGWVSMNNRDCDPNNDATVDAAEHTANSACPIGGIVSYGVDIPMADGNLSGYAWSEHYGWVSFNAGDVAGCPSGGTCTARRVGNTVLGWARILAIRDAGLNAGGWSGWISLNDANFGGSNYGVTIDALNNLPGYAYSDELGWIDFSISTISPIPPAATLKICEGSYQRSVALVPPVNIPLSSGATKTLTARYGLGDCSSDPLVSVTWSTELNPDDAVSLSTVSGNTVDVTANTTIATISENVVATYDPTTIEKAKAVVSCVALTCSNFIAQTNTYCPRDPQRSFNNSCSGTVSCPGTKVCNYDWTEGTP